MGLLQTYSNDLTGVLPQLPTTSQIFGGSTPSFTNTNVSGMAAGVPSFAGGDTMSGGLPGAVTSAASGAAGGNSLLSMLGGSGGLTSALSGLLGGAGGMTSAGSFNPFGPGGSPITDALGKTDPDNIFHQKTQQDSTADTQAFLDKNKVSYASPLNADGSLQTGFKVTPTAANGMLANDTALNSMRSRATTTNDQDASNPNSWLGMNLAQNQLNETSQLDAAPAQAMGAAAGARSQLEMTGGLDGGANERIAEQAARSTNASQQGIGRAAQSNALNLGIANDTAKNTLLGQTAQGDLANAQMATGVGEFNTGNALAANQGQNTFNLGQQQNNLSAYGASKQSDAIANAGKK